MDNVPILALAKGIVQYPDAREKQHVLSANVSRAVVHLLLHCEPHTTGIWRGHGALNCILNLIKRMSFCQSAVSAGIELGRDPARKHLYPFWLSRMRFSGCGKKHDLVETNALGVLQPKQANGSNWLANSRSDDQVGRTWELATFRVSPKRADRPRRRSWIHQC